jgi:capsid protein
MARKRPITRHAAHPLKGTAPGASMSAYQGASYTELDMSGWNPHSGSADADLLPDLDALTTRSRDLDRNNGVMGGAMQTMRDNIVGPVLRLSTMPDYRLLGWSREKAHAWGNDVEAKFRSWAETTECDAARSLNLMGMTIQALGMCPAARVSRARARPCVPSTAVHRKTSYAPRRGNPCKVA